MYLPSDTPLLEGQRQSAAFQRACSDKRIAQMRRTSAEGRARSFQTIIPAESITDQMGIGAGVNTQKLQDQTEVSRASGLLGDGTQSGNTAGQLSVQQIISGAPEVVSLNRGGTCQKPGVFAPVPLPADPRPGMPHRAPNIVPTSVGPMYVQGAPSTIPGDYNQSPMQPYASPLTQHTDYTGPSVPTVYAQILPAPGMSGIAPVWGDAWVTPDPTQSGGIGSWISDNPWLTLLLVGAGAYALSRGKR